MGNSRNTWLVLAAAAVVALMLAVPAFATVGDSGYMVWDSMAGANGTSPHGGYQTTTQKCVVCHAVHAASSTGEILLQDQVANACIYCHVGGGGGYTEVYEGDPLNYTADVNNAHNAWDGGPGVKCTSCHQVHAAQLAMTANEYLTTKLLVGDKNNDDLAYDTFAGAPQSSALDSNEVALTKWCTSCHNQSLSMPLAAPNTYYNDGSVATAHIMTSATAAYANPSASFSGKIAWGDSNYCSSCHSSGYGTSAWPHFTAGDRFLESAGSAASATAEAATDPQQDGICLRCHVSGTGSGVGVDF